MTSCLPRPICLSKRLLFSVNQQRFYHVSCCRKKSSVSTHETRIFSGIQPTGTPHIGNYCGAIRPWVELQNTRGHVILSIVDLHSITLPQNPAELRQSIHNMAACLLACGVDPEKTTLFQQSSVSEHAELAWVLNCMTNMSKLQHLPQWKIKSEAMKEVPLGLFTYPVLQSSDILLYKATEVPVGDDQIKHIELTRHLASHFNKKYGHVFPIPKAVVGNFKRIKNLRQPENKMSKSAPNSMSRIQLSDTSDFIREKIKKSVTDFTPTISYDPQTRPGVSNLVDIHCAFTDLTPTQVCKEAENMDTLKYKMHVADVVIEHVEPIRREMEKVRGEVGYIESVLDSGQRRAKSIASETYEQVKRLMGLM